jgi:hypothetical protein
MGFMCPSHAYSRGGFISKAAQAKIKGALAKKPNATVYSYPVRVMPSLVIMGRITTPPRLT